jgi:uncharacterized cupredoxin-like copper-binding protein
MGKHQFGRWVWGTTRVALVLLFLYLGIGLWMTPEFAWAAAIPTVDLAQQPAIEVRVQLGNEANDLQFFPDHFTFQAGKRYKLLLSNPSATKHYFTAKDFADGIWSQKVEAGQVEIKGAIHELELKPGAQAEWVFVPVKSGHYALRCPIAGHTEAGMVGDVTIKP